MEMEFLFQKLGFIRCRKDCERSCSSNGSESNYFVPRWMWFHSFERFYSWSRQRNRLSSLFLHFRDKVRQVLNGKTIFWSNILLINGVKSHLKCKLSNQRSILLILSTVNFSAIKSKHNWYLWCLIYKIFFRYRRSFDSEYSAPLVAYYIWPALMDGATVVAKGEAFTKRGAVSSCCANTIINYQ